MLYAPPEVLLFFYDIQDQLNPEARNLVKSACRSDYQLCDFFSLGLCIYREATGKDLYENGLEAYYEDAKAYLVAYAYDCKAKNQTRITAPEDEEMGEQRNTLKGAFPPFVE